jgi:proline racemase
VKFERAIVAIDSHTEGAVTRVVIGGIPHIPGKSMQAKKEYLQQHLDHVRTSLVHEPRGWSNILACMITPPVTERADLGLIFMEGEGYVNMCGHGTMGAATVALEMGMVEANEPTTSVVFDTPVGMVTARAEVQDQVVKGITLRNVSSFLYEPDLPIEIPNLGVVPVDIAFSGNFFAIVSAEDLNVQVEPKSVDRLVRVGNLVNDVVNDQVKVHHPQEKHIDRVDFVLICDRPSSPSADERHTSVSTSLEGVARGPCGSGACARMAALWAKGDLQLGETFVHEGILGTTYRGKLISEVNVGDFKAVVPEITGKAYIIGIQQFLVDPDDPLKYGFTFG